MIGIFFIIDYDCHDLPTSMNGHEFPRGCPGAVWSNGHPSRTYCKNIGESNGRFPWWEACCKWNGHKCVPKGIPRNV